MGQDKPESIPRETLRKNSVTFVSESPNTESYYFQT